MTRRILWQPVRRDELARAETADLVIDHADDPERLPNPVPSGPRFGLDLGAPVADQDCPVAFPGGLESEIVIDATIGEHDPGRVRRPLQVGARIWGIGRLLKVEDIVGERMGGKADEAATATARSIRECGIVPTRQSARYGLENR